MQLIFNGQTAWSQSQAPALTGWVDTGKLRHLFCLGFLACASEINTQVFLQIPKWLRVNIYQLFQKVACCKTSVSIHYQPYYAVTK